MRFQRWGKPTLLQKRFRPRAGVIRYKGKYTPVEVKANDSNAKSVKTILKHPEKYRVDSAIKLAGLNVGCSDEILTLSLYMAFLLVERQAFCMKRPLLQCREPRIGKK